MSSKNDLREHLEQVGPRGKCVSLNRFDIKYVYDICCIVDRNKEENGTTKSYNFIIEIFLKKCKIANSDI